MRASLFGRLQEAAIPAIAGPTVYCVPLSSSTRRAGTDLGDREFLPTARRPGRTRQGGASPQLLLRGLAAVPVIGCQRTEPAAVRVLAVIVGHQGVRPRRRSARPPHNWQGGSSLGICLSGGPVRERGLQCGVRKATCGRESRRRALSLTTG